MTGRDEMPSRGQLFAARYRLGERLGSGGMGDVYAATDTRTDAAVAVKVIRPHAVQDARARERFEIEVKVRAWIESEHVVRVLDACFEPSAGVAYLVMEHLVGETLAERVRRAGPLAPEVVIALLRQVASGLEAAHGHTDADGRPAPVVHRDLKPENLFLVRGDGGATRVKILDFGVAALLAGSREASRVQVGTAEYMAYEYLMHGASSSAMDVWALGLIVHYALTGRSYWRAARWPDSTAAHIIREILEGPIDSASRRLAEYGQAPGFPAEFDTWLSRCLEHDPARRPGAAQAVEELERVFYGRFEPLPELTREHRIEAWAWRVGLGSVHIASERATGERRWLKLASRALAARLVPAHCLALDVTPSALSPETEALVRVSESAVSDAVLLAFSPLHGDTLERHVRHNGPLEPAAARPVLCQLAAALEVAHAADTSDARAMFGPWDVLLTPEPRGTNSARLLFRLSGEQRERATEGARLEPALLERELGDGTPGWRARRDLALSAHFALTGESLWRALARTSVAGPVLDAVVLSLVHEPARSPPAQLPPPSTAPGVRAWALCCLGLDAERRFSSMSEAIAELEFVLQERASELPHSIVPATSAGSTQPTVPATGSLAPSTNAPLVTHSSPPGTGGRRWARSLIAVAFGALAALAGARFAHRPLAPDSRTGAPPTRSTLTDLADLKGPVGLLFPAQVPRLREALRKLGDTVATHRYDRGPWTAGQQIVALAGLTETPMPWRAADLLGELDPRCQCWHKSTLVLSRDPHNAATAWALQGLARLAQPAPEPVGAYLLRTQRQGGAWGLVPTPGPSGEPEPVAHSSAESTYVTSLTTLGLLELYQRGLIAAGQRERVLDAIERGVLWINRKREQDRATWKDFPNDPGAVISPAISGMAFHTLYAAHQAPLPRVREVVTDAALRELGRRWLDAVPRSLPRLDETERKSEVFVNPPQLDAINDVFQTTTPWVLLATADAFAVADPGTRRELAGWLNDALGELALGAVELERVSAWQAAEAMIGLRYILGDTVL
jgi:hypothetical protein